MIARVSILLLVSLLAAGCAHKGPASIAGGECKIFERPEYEVRGQKQYDQDWIDSNIEAGGGGCGWAPPQPRPPELDAAPATRTKAVVAPVKKKPSVIRRVQSRAEAAFTRRRAPIPALPAETLVLPAARPAAEPIAQLPPEPAPPRPPPPVRRSLVDQLLHPD